MSDSRETSRNSTASPPGAVDSRTSTSGPILSAQSLWQDAVYAARSLRRASAVSITIILTLALGLGVNAAMFSLLDVLFLRPPAGVARPDEIRRVWKYIRFRDGAQFGSGFDYSSYLAIKQAFGESADMALYRMPSRMPVGRGDDPPMANVSNASASFFRVLMVKPALGRFYGEDEDRLDSGAPVVVLSDAFWRRAWQGDRAVLGRELVLNGISCTIIGVAPPRFSGVDLDAADAWIPLAISPMRAGSPAIPWFRNPAVNGFQIILRLPAGGGARSDELEQRATVALRQPGVGFRQDTAAVARFGSIIVARGPGLLKGEMQVAQRLGGVAIVVLLIACANVVNLLLARAVRRRREIAVRLALGISGLRLVRMLLMESVLLAVLAAGAALAAAVWGGALLRSLLMPEVAWAESPLHWRVLLFALAAALLAGTVAGLVPAMQSRSSDLTSALKAGSSHAGEERSRLRSLLVVCQAALSVVLLVGAGLFVRSLSNVRGLDIGYHVDRIAFASVTYRGAWDSARAAATSARLLQLESRLTTVPGVERVAFTSMRPMWGIQFADAYYPQADTVGRRMPAPIFTAVTPGFFEATGTKLIRGRTFPVGRGPYTVIINQAMADSVWGTQDPIGRCIHFNKPDAPCATVIAISQTAILTGVKEQPSPHLYLPLDNMPFKGWGVGDIVVRVQPGRMPSALGAVQALLRQEFPTARISTNTMAASMEPQYRPWLLGATLFSLFGALATLVAAIGIYSSVSYAVSRRAQEFGIRAALGADAGSLVRLVLGEGTRTVAVGVAVGILLAIAGGRVTASLLYGVSPGDPFAMVLAGAAMLVIAALACIVPAWRAAGSDPVAVLRAD